MNDRLSEASASYSLATRRGSFKVAQFNNPTGSVAYRVVGTTPEGGRIRENSPTEGEAEGTD
jgi:hypothetical protein